MPVKVDDNTDIQSAYDQFGDTTKKSSDSAYINSGIDQLEAYANDPANHNSGLSDAEARGSDSAYINSGIDQLEAYANDPANHVRNAESSNGDANWSINRSNNSSGTTKPGEKRSFGKIAKKAGPTGGIVGLLIGAAFGISGISSPALLLNHITSGFLDKWDTRTTTATLRTNKLIVKKLVGNATSGSCSYIKIACRYNKPSNTLLKKLEKQGIKAVDTAGESVRTSGLWPNKRPDHFTFTRSNGVEMKVSAAELAPTLANDIEFRKAFHAAYNTRFQNFADSIYQKVLKKFGTNKADKLGDVTDETGARDRLTSASEGEDIGAKAAKEEGGGAIDNVIKKLLGEELSEAFKKIGKAGKGDAVGLVAGGVCLVADGPGMASKIVRTYQMAQLIKYAMVFLTVADKIKAGDATSAEVSALGAILTSTHKDNSGNTTLAAVDSFGIKNTLFGDTTTSSGNYKKFQPGGSIVASLSGITNITDSKAKKEACDIATNPLTGAAINVGLAAAAPETLGISLAGAAINIGVGWALGTALEKVATPLAEGAATLLKPAFQNILSGLLGDFTANLADESVGNALASGASNMLSQSANAGGNVPMSIADAVSFQNTQKQVNLAYAEEDRQGSSPLDASNPNTFLGSIVNQFIPYASQMATISGAFSTVSSITLGAFGNIISPSSYADASKEYSLCDDASINDGSIAVGPFCNIVYGIPNSYVNTDPDNVLQYLVNSGDISDESGEPKDDSKLKIWMETCLDGKTDEAVNCKIDGPGVSGEDSKRLAYYALYTVDHQIQKSMDDEDTETNNTPSSNTPVISDPTPVPSISGLPDGGVKDTPEGRKQAWQIAQQFVSDVNSKYGKNYKDISNYSLGYNRSSGTLGKSADSFACFGASRCGQCYALSAWFLDKYTKEHIGTTTGSGDGVVAYLKKQGVPTGNEAKVYSVFSYGRAVGGGGAHTGIVVGIDGDYAITVENNYNFGNTLYINKRPKSGANFRGTGDKTVFAYVNGILRSTPKSY